MRAKGSREAESEEPTVLHIRFCNLSNISKEQLGGPAQTWQQYYMQGCMVDLWRYKATLRERNFKKRIKAPTFLDVALAM